MMFANSIHFAYNQPELQKMGDFPAASGQTVSLLSNGSTSAPTFAFFPDTFNGSYLINAVVSRRSIKVTGIIY